MTPEGKVKKRVKEILNACAPAVWYCMPPANGYGRAGIPDIIGCYKEFFFAIECKAGKGNMTALQMGTSMDICTAGGSFWLVNDTSVDAFEESFHEWCVDKNGE